MSDNDAGNSSSSFSGVSVPTPPIPDDDGAASAELLHELHELSDGNGSGVAVLRALSTSRLLVPVVAILDSDDEEHGHRVEKESSMATVIADSPGHGRALLAFSSTDSLMRWNDTARPVALAAPLAARAAVAESVGALVVDVAGPVPFGVAGYELLLLAAIATGGNDEAYDPVVRAAIDRLVPYAWRSEIDLRAGEQHGPAHLVLPATTGDQQQRDLVTALANDRVLLQLLPQGLRVSFRDTPPAGPSDPASER